MVRSLNFGSSNWSSSLGRSFQATFGVILMFEGYNLISFLWIDGPMVRTLNPGYINPISSLTGTFLTLILNSYYIFENKCNQSDMLGWDVRCYSMFLLLNYVRLSFSKI